MQCSYSKANEASAGSVHPMVARCVPGAPVVSVRVIAVILALAGAHAVLWILNSHHGGEARATVARNNSKSGCVSAVRQNA